MNIFKSFFSAVWSIFDLICFILASITANVTTYRINEIAFGISMTVNFILAGLVSEMISKPKE